MNEMVSVYEGNIPERFADYFPDVQHVHLANFTRTAWDDLANLTGKEFPLFVPPFGDRTTHKVKAEKIEKIGYGYSSASRKRGGPDMLSLMKVWAWWLVGCADAVGMVLPDFERKTPYFTFRDPRSHLPPVGWGPWSQHPLDGTMFAYTLTLGELKARYPAFTGALNRRYLKKYNGGGITHWGGTDDTFKINVGEYYHSDCWMVATLDDDPVVLLESHQGLDKQHPGVCPVTPFTLYSPNHTKGRPFLADQVSIQAAFARMFSQKLDYFDQTLYPVYFSTPLVDHHLNIGPGALNTWADTGTTPPKVHVQSPANPIDADQMMSFVAGLTRVLNRNPEMMQGAGEANSAKALTELRSGVNATVQDGMWPAFLNQLPKLYSAAVKMDKALWPHEKKSITGEMPVGKTRRFGVTYTPAIDLEGYEECIEIEPGLGLGGYQGTLEIMQLVGAELMSEESAFEQLPYYKEPMEERRRIQRERLEKLMFMDFEAKGSQGIFKPEAYAEVRALVQDKGMDMFDAIKKLAEEGKLLMPPPEAAGPGGPGGGEDPLAALMAGMGGAPPGPASSEGLPSIGALREAA